MDDTEIERLAALARLQIVGSAPEPEFDELVELAAAICDAPVSLLSLVDERRQWLKAAVGVPLEETPRELTFCTHTIEQDGLLMLEDASEDPRFSTNPFVTDQHLRFYAGVPVASPDGQKVGTLSVLDTKPRSLSPTQIIALQVMGRQAAARMELRAQRMQVREALRQAEEAREQMASSERLFQTFMDSAPFVAYLKDADGKIIFYNQKCSDTFGITREQWIGKTDYEIAEHPDAERFRAHDREAIESGEVSISQERWKSEDGSESIWSSYKFRCLGEDGRAMVGGFWVDITEQLRNELELRRSREELAAANEQLIELAATDPLTSLANRRVFDERLGIEFAQAQRKRRALSVMLLDLDAFKRRNDLYGHRQGDLALQKFAGLLQSCVRSADLAARYGGEEFVVLLPETDEDQALQLAERILQLTRNTVWEKEPLTVSIGVCCMHAATPTTERLMSLADSALYAAKKAGRNQAISYSHHYLGIGKNITDSRS
jgi:diguanylate cyclase (GGDEF)-like protein/PAS domain S-box-containing protein